MVSGEDIFFIIRYFVFFGECFYYLVSISDSDIVMYNMNMSNLKIFIKKYLLPKTVLKFTRPIYHGIIGFFGNIWFGRPSEKMVVIGVTGTNGKSTTVNLIVKVLQQAGFKVGFTSTVNLNVGQQETLNNMKMTMPSGWLLDKYLKQMLNSGCQYAILEVSSEGLAQNRHLGINFDVAIFTNLTPEHLDAHGGFENYKKAKGKLFAVLNKNEITVEKRKINPKLQKTIITNADDVNSSYFASFSANRYLSYGIKNPRAEIKATDIIYENSGIKFTFELKPFILKLKGQFDVYNALAALALARSQNISLEISKQALENITVVPGRMEVLQNHPFIVLVDYAYEPEEMRQLYETISRWPHNNVLQVLGPTGGGRDKERIEVLGKMAGKNSRLVWVTTDDPYDEDPGQLAQPMVAGAILEGKTLGKDLFLELNRRLAIFNALKSAEKNDIVLVTGKGADQKMALANGEYIDWDDRKVVLEELVKISK